MINLRKHTRALEGCALVLFLNGVTAHLSFFSITGFFVGWFLMFLVIKYQVEANGLRWSYWIAVFPEIALALIISGVNLASENILHAGRNFGLALTLVVVWVILQPFLLAAKAEENVVDED